MNEQFASKISSEDKKAIEDMTKEALDWMDAHQDATKEEYEAKIKEVEGKIQPIFAKLYHEDELHHEEVLLIKYNATRY